MTNITLIMPEGTKEDLKIFIKEIIKEVNIERMEESEYVDSKEGAKLLKYESVRSFYNFVSKNKIKKHYRGNGNTKPFYKKSDILNINQH